MNDRLIARRVALDDEGRSSMASLPRMSKRRCSSPLLFGLDGETGRRPWEFEGHQVDVVLVIGIVQHAVELDFLDLGDGADVAGQQFVPDGVPPCNW